jgi:hypothetical protein
VGAEEVVVEWASPAPWTSDGVVAVGCLVEVEVRESACSVVAGEAETGQGEEVPHG